MRIMIVDDHEMVRRGMKMLLAKLFDDLAIEGFGNIPKLLERLGETEPPDIILLDLYLPGVQGMEGLDKVNQSFPEVPIAIISASEDVEDIVASIEHGARGFILKSSDEKVLKLAVSLVMSGEIYVPSRALKGPDMQLQGMIKGQTTRVRRKPAGAGEQFPDDNPLSQLTNSEYKVLRLLMRGQSNKEIGRNLDLVEGTVKKYVRMIFKKLNVSSRTQAVLSATQLGWPIEGGTAATRLPRPAEGQAQA